MDNKSKEELEVYTEKVYRLISKYNKIMEEMQNFGRGTGNNEAYAIMFDEIFKDKTLTALWLNLKSIYEKSVLYDELAYVYPTIENEKLKFEYDDKKKEAMAALGEALVPRFEDRLDNRISRLKNESVEQRTATIEKTLVEGQELLRKHGFTLLQTQVLLNDYYKTIQAIKKENPKISDEDAEEIAYPILVATINKRLATAKQKEPATEEDADFIAVAVSAMHNLLKTQTKLVKEQNDLKFWGNKTLVKYNLSTKSPTPRADYYYSTFCGMVFQNSPEVNAENYAKIMDYIKKNVKEGLPYNFENLIVIADKTPNGSNGGKSSK